MFERFTIDMLAEHVSDQLLSGEPSAKLAHRFFRKGRRDGKHGFEAGSVRQVVVDAVSLAGTALSVEFVERREELTREQARREQQLARHTDALAELEERDEESEAPVEAAVEAPEDEASETGPDTDGTVTEPEDAPAADTAAALLDAIETRRRLREERVAREAKESAEAAHRAALAEARSGIVEATDALSQIESALAELPAAFLERFLRVAYTGRLLWARYCNGYEQGRYRWFASKTEADVPDGTLDLTVPEVLGSIPAIAGGKD